MLQGPKRSPIVWYKTMMHITDVIDIRQKHKVRYLGVVHLAGSEDVSKFSMGALAPRWEPHGARCGVAFANGGETPAYIENAEHVVVTCVACVADRRRG